MRTFYIMIFLCFLPIHAKIDHQFLTADSDFVVFAGEAIVILLQTDESLLDVVVPDHVVGLGRVLMV